MIAATFQFPYVLILLSSSIIIGAAAIFFFYLSLKRLKYYRFSNSRITLLNPIPITFASLTLGLGVGGFIDGIVFHQILQWHGMLSNKLPINTLNAKSVNMFWDGVFHAFTLLIVVVGLIAFWKASRRSYAEKSGNLLAGGMLCGWAIFNLVEGILNHHIFRLHNVRENVTNNHYYNYAFLLLSITILVAGTIILSRYYKNFFKIIKSLLYGI